jgi:cytochrome c oxidase assembly protein subunit 15
MSPMSQLRCDRQIARWLFFCAALVVAMILLGGVTRLTHSGLSIVEWKPLLGAIPPLNEAQWHEVFVKYQAYPEYQLVNAGMSLGEFKAIFMFEYLHRLLGRLIGLAFLLPLVFFYVKGRIAPRLTPKLVMLFVLGGLQGVLGWYMVKSGLVDNPRVSQYRLTAHLGAAVLIYASILWVALGLRFADAPRAVPAGDGLRRFAYLITGLLFIMILSGGLVAGTRAGLGYNTFPLMGTSFIPQGLYAMQPPWLAAFEDTTTIQFNHRLLAYVLSALIVSFAVTALRSGIAGRARAGVYALLAMLLLQVGLGISTLLLLVPVPLASAHQAGAIGLFTCALLVSQALTVRGDRAVAALPAAA